ncbi:MAG: carboxypeptidase-like regulatory domain-containing protein, partial [Anaerolineae bacterium]
MTMTKTLALTCMLAALLLCATAPAMAAPQPLAPQPSAPQDTDVPPLAHAVELRVLSADGDSEPMAGSPVYTDGAFRGHTDASGKLVLEALTPGPHLVQVDLFALHPGYALASLGEVAAEGGAALTSSDIDRGKIALGVDVSASGSVACAVSMREEGVADSFGQAPSAAIPVPGSEDATATKEPWAGWWWPMRTGQTANGYFPHGAPGPLEKYDQYVEGTVGGDSQAKEW